MPQLDVFTALANPVRRDILLKLRTGPLGVTALARGFRQLGRPAVSEHLQVLRKARLVREEPRGRERWYHLDPRPLAELEDWVASFDRFARQRLAALEVVLAQEAERERDR
ncbi:MAG: metalloregulator ArsR/SmtB family transcription factor [Myxococcaceae bacterium]